MGVEANDLNVLDLIFKEKKMKVKRKTLDSEEHWYRYYLRAKVPATEVSSKLCIDLLIDII